MEGAPAELTAGERRFVDAAMTARGDEVRWVGWTLKFKREKVQDRLLVLGRYRLLSIKRSKVSGKKAIQREGHYFDLIKVKVGDVPGLSSMGVTFEFKGTNAPFKIEVASPKSEELVQTFRQVRLGLGTGVASDAPQYEGPSHLGWAGERPDTSVCGGIVETYEAWCNYFQLKPNHGLVQHLKDTAAGGSKELALSSCPGIETKTEYSINLLPLFNALWNNEYFTSVTLSAVTGRREAVSLLASTLEHNRTISRVVFSNLETPADAFVAVGNALKKNPANGIQEIDFSHNRMGEKGAMGLAQGLLGLQRGLSLLNVANNAITARGIASVVSSLSDNESIASTLTSLDLSINKIEKSGSQVLSYWATNLKDKSQLQELNLADTAIDIFNVLNSLRLGLSRCLTSLNLAHTRLEKNGGQAIGLLLESTQCLTALNLAYCKATPADISTILTPLATNTNIKDLVLDLSGNDLGPTGAQQMAKALGQIDNIHTLILRDNKLKDEGLRIVVGALMQKKNLKCVDLSYNIFKIGGSHYKDCLTAFADWFRSGGGANQLETLVICGDGKNYAMGPNFAEALLGLADNKSLNELDITGNKIGDAGMMKVFDNLRGNNSLTWIAFDNNGVGLGSLQALKNCVTNGNDTLLTVKFPSVDVSRAAGGNPKMHERLHELLTQVTEKLRDNRNRNPSTRPSNIRMIQESKKGANYGTIRISPSKEAESGSPTLRSFSSEDLRTESAPYADNSARNTMRLPSSAIPPPPLSPPPSPGRPLSIRPPRPVSTRAPPPPPPAPAKKPTYQPPTPDYGYSGEQQSYNESQGYEGYEGYEGYDGFGYSDNGQDYNEYNEDSAPPPPPARYDDGY